MLKQAGTKKKLNKMKRLEAELNRIIDVMQIMKDNPDGLTRKQLNRKRGMSYGTAKAVRWLLSMGVVRHTGESPRVYSIIGKSQYFLCDLYCHDELKAIRKILEGEGVKV